MGEPTRGQEALQRALREKRIADKPGQAWLAGVLDITQSAVSRWCTGDGRPDPHFRRAIESLVGIPEEAWWTAEEARLVRKAVRIGLVQYAQAQRNGNTGRASSVARSAGAAR